MNGYYPALKPDTGWQRHRDNVGIAAAAINNGMKIANFINAV